MLVSNSDLLYSQRSVEKLADISYGKISFVFPFFFPVDSLDRVSLWYLSGSIDPNKIYGLTYQQPPWASDTCLEFHSLLWGRQQEPQARKADTGHFKTYSGYYRGIKWGRICGESSQGFLTDSRDCCWREQVHSCVCSPHIWEIVPRHDEALSDTWCHHLQNESTFERW